MTDSIERFGQEHPFTKLVVDLKDQDPDDAFSSVPYEKGFVFLYYLEKLLGQSTFDQFISHYFSTFAQKSVDSFEFKDTIRAFFANNADASKKLTDLDWDSWFYKPGFPEKPDYDTSLADVVYALAEKWEDRARGKASFEPSPADIKGLTSNQIVVLLERLEGASEPALSSQDTQAMDRAYGFMQRQNVEIVARYFRVAMKAKDASVNVPTAELLGRTGRMKFVRPLYRGLNEVDRELALKTFEKHESFYHPICRHMVRQDLFGKK